MKFKLTLIAALSLLASPATNCGVFSKLATSARVAFLQPTFNFKNFAPKAAIFAGALSSYQFFKPTIVRAEKHCSEWDSEEIDEVRKKMDEESGGNWKLTRKQMDEEVRKLRKQRETEIAQYKREKLAQEENKSAVTPEDVRRILSTYCPSDYKGDVKDFAYEKASVRCITTLANMRNFLERAVEDRDKYSWNRQESRKINIMLSEMDELLRLRKR